MQVPIVRLKTPLEHKLLRKTEFNGGFCVETGIWGNLDYAIFLVFMIPTTGAKIKNIQERWESFFFERFYLESPLRGVIKEAGTLPIRPQRMWCHQRGQN